MKKLGKKIMYDKTKQIRTATQFPTIRANNPSTNSIPDNNKNISASRDGIGKTIIYSTALEKSRPHTGQKLQTLLYSEILPVPGLSTCITIC